MSVIHNVLNNIFHGRFLTDINMPSTLNMPEYASVAQGSVENNPSYSSGFQYASV